MWILLALVLQTSQAPTERQVLEADYARAGDSILVAATKSRDWRVQRLAVRAIGRFERPELRGAVVPLLRSPDASVRREAVNALGQMQAELPYAQLLTDEKDSSVRAVIYQTMGRVKPAADEREAMLVRGLREPDSIARLGAARGLEALLRNRTRATATPPATIAALREAMRNNTGEEFRERMMIALNAAGDRDSATTALALGDPSPLVRRLAVLGSRQWVDDPSPIVRYQALRVAGTCERAIVAVNDSSEHVALAAVDFLGDARCEAPALEAQADRGRTWRLRGRALVALTKFAPEAARKRLPKFAADVRWQTRAYAATAAMALRDEKTLKKLSVDKNPNVAIAALMSPQDAIRGLTSTHSGHVRASAERLKNAPEQTGALPALFAALDRLTKTKRATVRDERMALLTRIGEVVDPSGVARLRPLMTDPDPQVAIAAANIVSLQTGEVFKPRATGYVFPKLAAEATLRGLEGATARLTIKGVGAFTVELLTDDAPGTVATFASLATAGRYNGLTFHRIVPNFIIQGGSPGANEYDALTRDFMPDELGLTSNMRGTLGISTRGRDTGDGQIFVNLIDNFRLDHDYTVFARVIEGMNVVDRVQEGDVIESVVIRRKKPATK